MFLTDAHCHYQEESLRTFIGDILPTLPGLGLAHSIVNGTEQIDWPDVVALVKNWPFIIPAFGLHPWFIKERTPSWSRELRQFLSDFPQASVGEIGLDRWIRNHDLTDQLGVFHKQLDLAVELDRPATIHCVQAWGALSDALLHRPLPPRGFLIHAYGGPDEMTLPFMRMGGYFSFSPYFLHPRKTAQREIFRHLPLDRILVETDAPALYPPPELNPHPLFDTNGETLNHPANITMAYAALAEIRGMPVDELAEIVLKNFTRLFL